MGVSSSLALSHFQEISEPLLGDEYVHPRGTIQTSRSMKFTALSLPQATHHDRSDYTRLAFYPLFPTSHFCPLLPGPAFFLLTMVSGLSRMGWGRERSQRDSGKFLLDGAFQDFVFSVTHV